MASFDHIDFSALSKMSVAELVQLHEACTAVFSAVGSIDNQRRTTQQVMDFFSETFDSLSGEIHQGVIDLLKSSTTKDPREIDMIAKVLIPYHIDNENLDRALAEAAALAYRRKAMKQAA